MSPALVSPLPSMLTFSWESSEPRALTIGAVPGWGRGSDGVCGVPVPASAAQVARPMLPGTGLAAVSSLGWHSHVSPRQ